jgi:signal transduction histidine kinase
MNASLRQWLKPSLARRLLLTLLLACVALWGLIYLLGFHGTHRNDLGTFDRDLKSLAEAITHTLEDDAAQTAPRSVLASFDHLITAYHKHRFVVEGYMAFCVWDHNKISIYRSNYAASSYHFQEREDGFFDTLTTSDAHTPAEELRVYASWTKDHRYRVDVLQTIASRQTQYDSVMLNTFNWIVLGIVLLVLWLLAVLAVDFSLRPLRRLSQELSQRQPYDLTPVSAERIDPELRPVVNSINQTLARLDTVLTHERHALADLAHELRTPLAIMTHQVDQIRHSTDAHTREAAILRLEQVLQRTNRLTHQLLTLGRLQSTTEAHWETIALPDVIRDNLAAHAPWAAERGIELSYVGPETLTCSTSSACIELILDNLIRNAIVHGHEGGHVEVRLLPALNRADLPVLGEDCIELSVLDDGPGLPTQDTEQIWKRFGRGTQTPATGTGLGLAIVASAVQQMGGRVHTHAGLKGQGLGVSITWTARSRMPSDVF